MRPLVSILLLALPLLACGPGGDEPPSDAEASSRHLPDERADVVEGGAHLLLAYDRSRSAFLGRVEPLGDAEVRDVRVTVHLSEGEELGPTERFHLTPGGTQPVALSAGGANFRWWTAHLEVGSAEAESER